MVQQLASGEELHPVVRKTMQANIELITNLIREGQEDGTIRAGNPQLMALSVGGQPIFLALIRSALQQAVSLDQDDLETRKAMADSVVGFARAGLRAEGEWRQ
jgi:fatty acid/phospholipid biosynthesis enzyme